MVLPTSHNLVPLNESYLEKNHSMQWSENLRAILNGFTYDGEVQIKFC
jgi:hypothetical protein